MDVMKNFGLLNKDLTAIYYCAETFDFMFIPSKFKAIILGSRHMLNSIGRSNLLPLLYNEIQIPFSANVTNLRVFFNSDLSYVMIT